MNIPNILCAVRFRRYFRHLFLAFSSLFILGFHSSFAIPINIISVVPDSVSCNGGNDGQVSITFTGGTAPYFITWKGPNFATTNDTTYTITGLSADAGFWIVVDGSGPGETDSRFGIVIGEPDPILVVEDLVVPVSCNGGSNGSIDISVSGGNTPYTFAWSGPGSYSSSAEDISGLATGDYTLILTDNKGCSVNHGPVTITEPPPITVTTDLVTMVSCNGAGDGAIDISVAGGTMPYTYVWSGPGPYSAFTEDVAGLSPGSYSLVVTDDNGCTANHGPINITEPPPITITTDNITHISCNGINDGSISISVTGGTPSYSYAWSGPGIFSSTNQDIGGLAPGNYSLVMTDANGCVELLGPINITEPSAISVVTNLITPVSCNGGNDGAITVTVAGGTPPYTFAWSGPGSYTSPNEDISGLISGNYSLLVTDDNGCTYVHGPVNVPEPAPLLITIVSVSDVSCNGAGDGAIDVNVTGGTTPFNYSWSGPGSFSASTQDLSSLDPGNYNLVVTDDNGCISNAGPISISEPLPLNSSVDVITQITCNGANNGAIDISVSGGTLPYLYSWTGPGSYSSSSEDIGGLGPGDYNLLLTDGNGCTDNLGPITIIEPTAIVAATVLVTDVSCSGGNDGAIDVSVVGGTPGYLYAWSGPGSYSAITEDISGLQAGDYNLTITDLNGCINLHGPVTVDEPPPIAVSNTLISHVSCFGGSDGAIDIFPSGGTPPYSYSWSGPGSFSSFIEDLSGLLAGTYTLTLTDSKGCVYNHPGILLNEPAALSITLVNIIDIACNGDNNGSIDITASGGTAPYSYSWTGPGAYTSNNADISGLGPGDYSLTVTDNNGCTANLGPLTVFEPLAISVNPGLITDISCFGGSDGSIEVAVSGGNIPYTYSWSGPGGFTSNLEDINGLQAGDYTLSITDINGCPGGIGPITLAEPPDISIDNETVNPVFGCAGDNTGSILILASGGTPPLEYSINGGSSFQAGGTFLNLLAGNYQVVVQDANGCTKNGNNLFVTEPQPVQITNISEVDVRCFGENNGTITITAIGGTAPLEYSINNGSSFQPGNVFSGLTPGTYDIVVRDANLCTLPGGQSTINEPTILSILSEISTDISCQGGNDGTIDVVATGGTTPYFFSRDGGSIFLANNGDFNDLTAGSYDIVVRDDRGCEVTGSTLVLNEPAALSYDLDTTKATCNFNTSDGSIEFTNVAGGTAPYQYSIDGGTNYQPGSMFNNLLTGTYDAVLLDVNGCSLTQSIDIESKYVVTAEAGNDTTICPGDDIVLNGSGGDLYLWTPSEGLSSDIIANPVAAVSNPTTYYLTVAKDVCSAQDSVFIDLHPLPAIDAGKDTSVVLGFPIILEATGGPFVSFEWVPSTWLENSTTNPTVANIENDIIYYIIGTTVDGCRATDSIILTLARKIDVASGFTPNDDGFNDTWKIRYIEFYPNATIDVYNRWGERLFHFSGIYSGDNEWDGTYRGKELPMGTYYYVIQVNDGLGSKPVTGPVTIIK